MELESLLFTGSILAFVASFLLHSLSAALGKPQSYTGGRLTCLLGALLATAALGLRWQSSGHPPLSNMYESMVTMATLFAWVTLYFTRAEAFPLIEAGAAVGAILMIGVASVFAREVRPLIPALQSYWLHLHVFIAFLGESCFALSFLMSYLFCARRLVEGGREMAGEKQIPDFPWSEKLACVLVVFGLPLGFLAGMVMVLQRLSQDPAAGGQWRALLFWVIIPSAIFAGLFFLGLFLLRGAIGRTADRWLPPIERLDELTYRAIALGYPLFTVGAIIFGMVWANKAWGRYWGWDPKETWALITFLVYSAYLHLRLTKGWRGTHTAVLSVVGFLFTMFTLFGVNLLLAGLHSYAGG